MIDQIMLNALGAFLQQWPVGKDELSLENRQFGDDIIPIISNFISTHIEIIKLNLSGNNFTTIGFEHLSLVLQEATNHIISLNLSFNPSLNIQSSRSISRLIRRQKVLTSLYLTDMQMSSDAAKELASAIAYNHTLTHLDLSCNNLNDEGAIAIGKALSTNIALKSLLLSCNQIGPSGARKLSEGLAVNTSLIELDVRYNFFTVEGGADFLKLMHQNITLTDLKMDENLLSRKDRRALWSLLQDRKRITQNIRTELESVSSDPNAQSYVIYDISNAMRERDLNKLIEIINTARRVIPVDQHELAEGERCDHCERLLKIYKECRARLSQGVHEQDQSLVSRALQDMKNVPLDGVMDCIEVKDAIAFQNEVSSAYDALVQAQNSSKMKYIDLHERVIRCDELGLTKSEIVEEARGKLRSLRDSAISELKIINISELETLAKNTSAILILPSIMTKIDQMRNLLEDCTPWIQHGTDTELKIVDNARGQLLTLKKLCDQLDVRASHENELKTASTRHKLAVDLFRVLQGCDISAMRLALSPAEDWVSTGEKTNYFVEIVNATKQRISDLELAELHLRNAALNRDYCELSEVISQGKSVGYDGLLLDDAELLQIQIRRLEADILVALETGDMTALVDVTSRARQMQYNTDTAPHDKRPLLTRMHKLRQELLQAAKEELKKELTEESIDKVDLLLPSPTGMVNLSTAAKALAQEIQKVRSEVSQALVTKEYKTLEEALFRVQALHVEDFIDSDELSNARELFSSMMEQITTLAELLSASKYNLIGKVVNQLRETGITQHPLISEADRRLQKWENLQFQLAQGAKSNNIGYLNNVVNQAKLINFTSPEVQAFERKVRLLRFKRIGKKVMQTRSITTLWSDLTKNALNAKQTAAKRKEEEKIAIEEFENKKNETEIKINEDGTPRVSSTNNRRSILLAELQRCTNHRLTCQEELTTCHRTYAIEHDALNVLKPQLRDSIISDDKCKEQLDYLNFQLESLKGTLQQLKAYADSEKADYDTPEMIAKRSAEESGLLMAILESEQQTRSHQVQSHHLSKKRKKLNEDTSNAEELYNKSKEQLLVSKSSYDEAIIAEQIARDALYAEGFEEDGLSEDEKKHQKELDELLISLQEAQKAREKADADAAAALKEINERSKGLKEYPQYIAKVDYKGETEHELSYKRGDIIYVTAIGRLTEWWIGFLESNPDENLYVCGEYLVSKEHWQMLDQKNVPRIDDDLQNQLEVARKFQAPEEEEEVVIIEDKEMKSTIEQQDEKEISDEGVTTITGDDMKIESKVEVEPAKTKTMEEWVEERLRSALEKYEIGELQSSLAEAELICDESSRKLKRLIKRTRRAINALIEGAQAEKQQQHDEEEQFLRNQQQQEEKKETISLAGEHGEGEYTEDNQTLPLTSQLDISTTADVDMSLPETNVEAVSSIVVVDDNREEVTIDKKAETQEKEQEEEQQVLILDENMGKDELLSRVKAGIKANDLATLSQLIPLAEKLGHLSKFMMKRAKNKLNSLQVGADAEINTTEEVAAQWQSPVFLERLKSSSAGVMGAAGEIVTDSPNSLVRMSSISPPAHLLDEQQQQQQPDNNVNSLTDSMMEEETSEDFKNDFSSDSFYDGATTTNLNPNPNIFSTTDFSSNESHIEGGENNTLETNANNNDDAWGGLGSNEGNILPQQQQSSTFDIEPTVIDLSHSIDININGSEQQQPLISTDGNTVYPSTSSSSSEWAEIEKNAVTESIAVAEGKVEETITSSSRLPPIYEEEQQQEPLIEDPAIVKAALKTAQKEGTEEELEKAIADAKRVGVGGLWFKRAVNRLDTLVQERLVEALMQPENIMESSNDPLEYSDVWKSHLDLKSEAEINDPLHAQYQAVQPQKKSKKITDRWKKGLEESEERQADRVVEAADQVEKPSKVRKRRRTDIDAKLGGMFGALAAAGQLPVLNMSTDPGSTYAPPPKKPSSDNTEEKKKDIITAKRVRAQTEDFSSLSHATVGRPRVGSQRRPPSKKPFIAEIIS